MQRLAQKSIKSTALIFLSSIAALITCGTIFIYSSSSIYAFDRFGIAHFFVQKQIIGLCIGLLACIGILFIPTTTIKHASPFLFVTSLLCTALTLAPQFMHKIHGSRRWVKIYRFTFQPSELLKIGFILYIAYLLDKKKYHTASFLYGYMPFLCITGITGAVLLLQPDFGLTVTLTITTLILLFIAQHKRKHILLTMISALPVVAGLIYYKPYRFKRILTFLDPWADPQGSGFQIIQSLIAIGSGGLWGLGISHSKQKFFYLPMQHTDFIFSIIAEETGFIGSVCIVSLYLLFAYSGLKLALRMNTHFKMFATLGFVILISLQALINIAVTLGLVPTKGLALPFISYGNSGLLCALVMVGIIINFLKRD